MKKYILGISFVCILYLFLQVNITKVNKVHIKTNKFSKEEKITLLQISDVHDKKLFMETILEKIKKLKPDMIVFTGDLIDGKTKEYENIYSFVEKVIKINPNVYFVSGNHEWRNKNTKAFLRGLKERQVKILNNDYDILKKESITLNIYGIDDPYTHHDDLKKALSHKDDSFSILLSHSPNIIFREKPSIDLILCGHTHGGQIRIPFIGAVVVPGQGLFPKYDKGIFSLGKTTLYIDSGLGTSTAPIRSFNQSQMSLIIIEGE
ncbi:metallophosphoesterase [Inediibacterium massiliense]|uniref:metallophosphoesterase n=1 Tax=Inediibacterium massiliense TaxID=1658111 RepID=UPI0006B5E05E|nr:metallophosphoesterase [Inediibacterium massiliense]